MYPHKGKKKSCLLYSVSGQMKSALVGSWHNSGFYGHYRGQVKNESAGEYRLAAKPQPPAVFLKRSQEPAKQHFFSKHDNRISFDKGPYWLLQGIGRRKDLERLWQRHTFLRWAPSELDLSRQRPLKSSYQIDFQPGSKLGIIPQRLVDFMKVQTPYVNTTYQQNFCQPSHSGYCGINKINFRASVKDPLPDLPDIRKPKLLQHYLHAGVSECLNWSTSLNK
ncbi:ciliary microtubule inner protein 7 isoform 2-T2 [Thomomys bottae]